MDEGLSGFCIKASSTAGNIVRGCGGGHSHTSTTTTAAAGTKCGRWNPTAEQVKVLTDLFRAGLRTPSTDQIQKISAQLSFYGKIESKNVFYWFQNHKARERQKRRKVSVRDDFHKSSILRRDDKFSSSASKRFDEINQGGEHERVIETLQLFPLNPFEESESEKCRVLHANDYCKDAAFSYTFGTEMDHPPLELRLSFM